MELERFETLIAAYGADPGRWPEAERESALALAARSAAAQARLSEARALDSVLDAWPAPALGLDPGHVAAAASGVSAAAVRADAPAMRWPGAAALAAAAVAGLLVGWADFTPADAGDPYAPLLLADSATSAGEEIP